MPFHNASSSIVCVRKVLMLVCLLAIASTVHAREKLYIFTEHYPPYNSSTTGQGFAHQAEDISGLCAEMVKAMMARTDLEYVMKMRAWSLGYDRVQRQPNHALFCTGRTEEREDRFEWVGPLASIQWTLFAAPESEITLASLEDARDYSIAGYKGDIMSEYLVSQGFDVVMGMNGEMNPRRLMLGQVDLWVTDGLNGPLIAEQKQGVSGLRPVLVFRETPMYLAVNKDTDPAVVAELHAALAAAQQTGEWQQILARYGQ